MPVDVIDLLSSDDSDGGKVFVPAPVVAPNDALRTPAEVTRSKWAREQHTSQHTATTPNPTAVSVAAAGAISLADTPMLPVVSARARTTNSRRFADSPSSADSASSPFPASLRTRRHLARAEPPTDEAEDERPAKRPRFEATVAKKPAESQRFLPPPRSAEEPAPSRTDTQNVIDLLSSDNSEEDNIDFGNAPPKQFGDPVGDDLDDLLLDSSPPSRQASRVRNPDSPVGTSASKDKAAVEILTLSSSSPPSFPRSVSDKGVRRKGDTLDSAPPRQTTRFAKRPLQRSFSDGQALTFTDEDSDGDDFESLDDLLAAWRTKGPVRPAQQKSKTSRPRRTSMDEGPVRSRAPKPSSSTAISPEEREARRREKEAEREARRKEKEAEREQRQKEKDVEKERRRIAAEMAKERKAKERAEAAAFYNANRSRTDKAVAAPEMIVRLPTSLPQATREVAETLLGEIKAQSETWTSTPVDNVVTWKRKVEAEYKADLGHWVPVPARVEDEQYALVVMRGDELVQLILAGRRVGGGARSGRQNNEPPPDLESHIRTVRRAFPKHRLLYLIEGLGAWKSKNRSIRNRQFTAAVRNAGEPATTARAAAPIRPSERLGKRAQKSPQEHVDEAVVEDAMLELQVAHDGLMVHETQTPLDTARWLKVFTEQIATAPYREQKEALYAAAAAFCMDSGQIGSGDDTYTLMLQQIARVTEPVALGVAARFGSVQQLVAGLAEEGPLALEACLKSRNRNGALSERAVGPALSRRIYKVFMGEDAASTDV